MIISSDKTTITTWGGKTAYPVYLTIGNLPKDIRRKPSHGGQMLLAYLPTSKLDHITNEAARKRMVLNIMHKCLKVIFQPLETAGIHGIPMASGDGVLRRGHPLYAAHAGDYMEQIAVVGCKMGDCPQCDQPPNQLGELVKYPQKDLPAILNALKVYDDDPAEFLKAYREAKVKPIIHPFWENLPYCNIHLCITPDVLHQLLQGMVKHLVNWIKGIFPSNELNARCKTLPRNSNVRHFFRGITPLSKITGREHNDIARIILGIIIDLPLPNQQSNVDLLIATRAMLDFLFLAQYPVHSDDTLKELQAALETFHDHKEIFIELGIRKDFNLPKLHFLSHYVAMIKWTGTTDNFDTEFSERLHIDLTKNAFDAGNGIDEFTHMTIWLERKEKMLQFDEYIKWRQDGCPPLLLQKEVYPSHRIAIAKNPSKRNVSFYTLKQEYSATYIVDALARYVAQHRYPGKSEKEIEKLSTGIAIPFSQVDVYHKARFWLGHSKHHPLSANEYNTLHVVPQRLRQTGNILPEQFNTALINEGLATEFGTTGHRVAQVRVLFSIQQQYAARIFTGDRPVPRIFAYIEWFDEFEAEPTGPMRLWTVKRSMEDGHRMALVIPIGHITRSVHLFPNWNADNVAEWSSVNVLEKCTDFYLNPFSDRHAYHFFG